MAIPITTPADNPSEEEDGGDGEDGVRGGPPPPPLEGLDGGPEDDGEFRVGDPGGVTGAGGDPSVVGAGGDD